MKSLYKGDKIICTNGHVIGEVLEDLAVGDRPNSWADCFGNWTQDDIPKVGTMHVPKCATCGAEFIGLNWSLHISGWRP